uniref:NlpC/P60 family protein n=1 Tax=Fannyhessea vaginae TaxID=82135 RepID=UPI0023F17B76
GWFKTKSGYWFYFNQDHTMKTGILTDKGYTFWLDKNDGLLYNEWVKDESGNWLHTDGNGCLLTGWYHAPNGKWFYFNKDTYQMVTGKLTDDNKDYWLDENAGLLYDSWVQVSQNSWMHTDSNGVLVKGWYTISNGKRFYFDPQDLLTRFKKVAVDNHFYWIDQDAGLLYNTIVSDGNSKFLIDGNGQVQGQITDDVFIASDGSTPTGLISACGKNFYVDPHSKKLRKGTFTVNDLHFYANDDYVLLDHTEEINGKLYAYSKLGTPCSGWLYSNDAWYYAADASGLCATGWQKVNGVYYYLDPTTYQMQTGWLTDPTGVFYLESNGAMLASCDKTIDGYVYRFDSNGRCDKVGYQNPAGYFRVSSWNVPSVWGAPYPFNYMTPSRIGVNASRQECIDAFLSRAKEYIGTPYVWDYACAPGVGTDCVGLVMQCAYACGMDLGEFNPYDHWATGPYGWHSHDANNLYNSGMYQSINLADRQPGDLIFWRGHVAIYCGGDWIIEAYPPDVHWSHLYDHGAPIGCGRIFI